MVLCQNGCAGSEEQDAYPEKRSESVDFSDPLMTGVREVVVTGPSAEPIASLDDLAGKEVHVRKSSSYYESLTRLNEQFKASTAPSA